MLNQDRIHIPPTVLAQAAEWFAVLGSDHVSSMQTQQWQSWLEEHPDNRAAWSRVEYFTGKFQDLPAHEASAALNAPDLERRRTLKVLALFGVVGLSGWKIKNGRYLEGWTADYQTALGETKTIILADGSKVILDTHSYLNVTFTANLRQLQLISGEIYIETAPDNTGLHRPFVVDSQEGRVRALGTRFSVSQQQGSSQVSVFADAVEITPVKQETKKLILRAGQSTYFTQEQIGGIRSMRNIEHPAWTQGILLADNLPLSEFLLQLNRYRYGYITCDPKIAGLRIVGAFPLNDTDRILASLEETFPVKISYPLPLWIKVLPS
jgi:transmembrane sensor